MKKYAVLGVCSIGLLVVFSTAAMAQGRGGMMGARLGKLGLIRMEQVQKELKLSEETIEKITEIFEEVAPAPGGGGGGPDPEAIKNAESEIMKLLDDGQKKRLTGLFVQRAGSRALTDEAVIAALKIDADLQEEIKGKVDELSAGMREKMTEIFQNAGDDREGAQKKVQELQAEMDKEVMALLSDEQRKIFEDMKGEKFEFPAMGRGPGGRGGAGGGGRPGGGGEGRPQRPGGGGNDKGGGGL